MLRNVSLGETNSDNYKNKIDEQLEQKVCIMDLCIPKLEPCYFHASGNRLNEDTLSTNETLTSSIPFIIPYKVKDPIVLLERCDKIWETLQLIKQAQNKRNTNSFNEVSSEKKKSKSYIEYQPVLSNDNAAVPNFEFSVKTKKKLFQCVTCGKLYTKHSTLRYHAERVHRIFMTPLRSRCSTLYWINTDKEKRREKERKKGKETEREFDVVRKEKNYVEQNCSKRNENKVTRVPLQSTTLSLIRHHTFNHNRLKTRSSVSQQLNNNVNDCDISKKKQDKRMLSKDLLQSEKQILEDHDQVSLMCSLCKQRVKDIKKHLTDYHKIESSDFMLKELEKTSTSSEFNELDDMDIADKSLNECNAVQNNSRVQGKPKRKLNVSLANSKKKRKTNRSNTLRGSWRSGTRQCDVCFGIYKRHSFYKHKNRHRIRGETKENIHLFRCKYLNSPLCFKQKEEDASSKTTNSSKQKDKHALSPSSSKKKEAEGSPKKSKEGSNSDDNCEARCSCGKLFQSSNALSMHKKSCNLKNNKISTAVENSNESASHDKQHDRDTIGNGISITIKKKNNSYEIVGKDNGTEEQLQDSNHSKSSRVLSDISQSNVRVKSQEQSPDDPEASKYSKYHSILKIQTVEEDVDIDIEDELQTKSCNNNINQMSEILKDFCEEEENQKINTAQNQKVKSKSTDKAVPQEQRGTNKLNIVKKYRICICGSKFYNMKAFDVHIDKHRTNSELLCGYCKCDFTDINIWMKHECPTEGGKSFIDLPIQIDCTDCSVTFNMFKLFDEHIKATHSKGLLPFKCFECCKRFSSSTARKVHFNAKHGETVCSICQKTLQCREKSKHEAYHYGLGFPCHLCKKAYTAKGRLAKHRNYIHYRSELHIADYNKSCFTNPEIEPLHERDKLDKKLKDLNKDVELES